MFEEAQLMEESDRSVTSTPQKNTGNSSSQETADNSIPALAENINHTINWINSTYRPKKKSADFPRAELYTLLCTKVDDLACNILPQLQEEKTSSALKQFVTAATIHLSLLQELAALDTTVSKSAASSHVKVIKEQANHYADHAETVHKQLVEARVSQITPVSITQLPAFYKLDWDGSIVDCTKWTDTGTGETFADREITGDIFGYKEKKLIKLENRVEKARAKYIKAEISKLRQSLFDPESAARAWRKLIKTPLNAKTTF
jgi:hypothetical protein